MCRYFQCLSDLLNIVDSDIQDTSLNLRDIDIRHLAFEAQSFLCKTNFCSEVPNISTQSFSQAYIHLQILQQIPDTGLTLNGRLD
jgi:hypothetical protein